MTHEIDRRDPARQHRRRGGHRLTDLTDPQNPGFLRVSAVAHYFDVGPRTVEKWIENGYLELRTFPDRCRRIPIASIVQFANNERYQFRHNPPEVA